uniref:Mce/MlaD domain-containing protein n=1 Tax=Leptosiphonia brodiei TaxID=2608611 RepID=A0A1Z1MA43_9FLOR|nr:hypothetical protein [Leptosiphonia brodiei]ARW62856.1 hypothetical protein [Leptosiphonia brodiei]
MLNFSRIYSRPYKSLKIFLSLLVWAFCAICFTLGFFSFNQKSYSLFVEFDDAYGLKEGTLVTYKGVNIGVVSRISLSINKVVILLTIKSCDILIPLDTIFEANQIGLFNDIIISIKPQCNFNSVKMRNLNMYTNYFDYKFIPHNSYIKGYKGISYDDLIRSTTRISQRFDDPRFFSLFYLLLKNSFHISDEILVLVHNSSTLSKIIINSIILTLSKYVF